MPYQTRDALPAADAGQGQVVVDQLAPRYGVAVRDIFSDARWTPAEPVRVRDWHDTAAQSSETDFD